MHFAALELHTATPIAWIVTGLAIDFSYLGLTRIAIRISRSSGSAIVTRLQRWVATWLEIIRQLD